MNEFYSWANFIHNQVEREYTVKIISQFSQRRTDADKEIDVTEVVFIVLSEVYTREIVIGDTVTIEGVTYDIIDTGKYPEDHLFLQMRGQTIA